MKGGIPDGFEVIHIPEYEWAVFKCVGPSPAAIQDMWERIYKEWLPVSDYELMPSLGMLTINALACADSVLIPVQAAYLPVKGLEQLIKTIGRVQRRLNKNLRIEGILLTMVDARTNYARDISKLVIDTYSNQIGVFQTCIPLSVRAAEISAEGSSIYQYDPKGKAANAYRTLTEEMLYEYMIENDICKTFQIFALRDYLKENDTIFIRWTLETSVKLTEWAVGLLTLIVGAAIIYSIVIHRWGDLFLYSLIFAGIMAILMAVVVVQDFCDSMLEKISML